MATSLQSVSAFTKHTSVIVLDKHFISRFIQATASSSAAAYLPPALSTSRQDIQAAVAKAAELRARRGRWIRRRDLREEAGGGRGRDDEGRDVDGDADVVHDGSVVGKRFYGDTTVRRADDGNGWTVMLDYRTLKSPAKRPHKLPSPTLAMAIAAEWEYQVL
ncbi:uncharacterized protein [Miscanthus floridulus]|uniref:uncharacterized protein n=1 Tax=Miscanthus floridulus TaxID=154761 RepID=UPI00345A41C8